MEYQNIEYVRITIWAHCKTTDKNWPYMITVKDAKPGKMTIEEFANTDYAGNIKFAKEQLAIAKTQVHPGKIELDWEVRYLSGNETNNYATSPGNIVDPAEAAAYNLKAKDSGSVEDIKLPINLCSYLKTDI